LQAFAQNENTPVTKRDTFYTSLADAKIINMLKTGKAPVVTIAVSFNYHVGHLDLAANDNTYFRKDDYIYGRNFGTRYGYGASITGKIALHKEGNVRLNVSAAYTRFQSNFVISASPEGKVAYNIWGFALGFENNFTPTRKFKPYIGADFVVSLIGGNATLTTDTANFSLKIKNSLRMGAAFNLGFEYAVNNNVGFNLGYKLTYANIIGKENKASSNPAETYLNDAKVTSGSTFIPFAGWKQFLYSTFYTGINVYFKMKNKK
jgi:opacity protein-like surface antigen